MFRIKSNQKEVGCPNLSKSGPAVMTKMFHFDPKHLDPQAHPVLRVPELARPRLLVMKPNSMTKLTHAFVQYDFKPLKIDWFFSNQRKFLTTLTLSLASHRFGFHCFNFRLIVRLTFGWFRFHPFLDRWRLFFHLRAKTLLHWSGFLWAVICMMLAATSLSSVMATTTTAGATVSLTPTPDMSVT